MKLLDSAWSPTRTHAGVAGKESPLAAVVLLLRYSVNVAVLYTVVYLLHNVVMRYTTAMRLSYLGLNPFVII